MTKIDGASTNTGEQDQVGGQEQVRGRGRCRCLDPAPGDGASPWGPTPAPGPAAGGAARPPTSVVVMGGSAPYFFSFAASSRLAFLVASSRAALGPLAQHRLVHGQLEGRGGDVADARGWPAGT